ncbi:MAG: hypothetical protein DPW16_00495 [Chloroflexi bacterium]|nr:hypothetical protein [Chloroflexota bacterium]
MQLKYLFNHLTDDMTPEERYWWDTTRKSFRQYPKDILFWLSQLPQGGTPPMPPPHLRYRVAGDYDVKRFNRTGKESRRDFEAALQSIGKAYTDFHSILDFGVGCGRIMRWMKDRSRTAKLYGTDIDELAINWSKKHIRYAQYEVNQGLPPLNYADEQFDLVYAHSVFSHLDEKYQDAWLGELKRVTKPGAVLLLTIHGDFAWQSFYNSAPDLPAMIHHVMAYEENGFCFASDDEWTGVFPDFYHSMFHQKSYIMKHWGQFFTVRNYLLRGMLSYQDIVVLQKE